MSGPEGSSIKQVLYVHQGCFGGVRSLQKLHLKLNKATCAVFLILLRKTAAGSPAGIKNKIVARNWQEIMIADLAAF